MDNGEAAALLKDHLAGYRMRPYSELVALLGKPQVAELRSASGTTYQVEVEVHWDGRGAAFVSLAPSMMAGGERSALFATTSSWHQTDGSLESRTIRCLTPR